MLSFLPSMEGTPPSKEETNNLTKSTKKVKTGGLELSVRGRSGGVESGYFEERRKSSYNNKVMGIDPDSNKEEDNLDLEGNISEDDYELEEEEKAP